MEQIVAHIASRDEASLPTLFLEDVALCAAWIESYRDNQEQLEKYPTLRESIDCWLDCVDPDWVNEQTAGSRQQPLLRAYLNELIRGNVDSLKRDELDFVYYAWMLAERSTKDGLFERSIECMRPFIHLLEKARAGAPLCPGLPNIALRVAHFSRDDLKQAEPRDVKIFAGIDSPVRGPVLVHTGDVKILCDIPEDCSVVVEEGSCYVRGGVYGKLAAAKNCEIIGPVSGIVITRRGHVRAGSVLNPAQIISKEGSVTCVYAEAPRLLFACNELHVLRGAVGGRYRAQDIRVDGPLEGGEVQFSGKLTAPRLEATDNRALNVVLRRSLNCRDYGEVLTHESMRLLSNALQIRQRIHHLRGLMLLTDTEADEYAGTVLGFILGTESLPAKAMNIQGIHRNIAYVDRLGMALATLIKTFEDQLDMEEHGGGESGAHDAKVDMRLLMEDMETDLGLLVAEGPIPKEVTDYRYVVIRAARQMQRAFVTEQQIIVELQTLLKLRDVLEEKRDELRQVEEESELVVADSGSQAAVLEKARQNKARVEVLSKLLTVARKGGGSEVFRKRCNDRYVKLMQRNIENRKARVIEYASQIRKLENDIAAIRSKLWRDYRVSLPKHVVEHMPEITPTVKATFSEGVRLLGWQHLLETRSSEGASTLVTTDTGDEVVTYVRLDQGAVRRQSLDEPRRRRY